MMEQSPLTRQTPPETFQPKIIQLYESLFKVRFGSLRTTSSLAVFVRVSPLRKLLFTRAVC